MTVRARYVNVAVISDAGTLKIVPNAIVTCYEPGTTTPLAQTIFAAVTGGTTLPNPFTTDALGNILFFLANPQRVKLVATGIVNGAAVALTIDHEPALPDPSEFLRNGQTATADFLGDVYTDRLGVGFDSATFAIPTGNLMLVSKTATEATGQMVSLEYNNTGDAGSGNADVSALRVVARSMTSGNVQERPLEVHMIKTVGTGDKPTHGIEVSVQSSVADAAVAGSGTGFWHNGVRIMNLGGTWSVPTPQRIGNFLYAGGDEYGAENFILYQGTFAEGFPILFRVTKTGRVVAGDVVPKTTATHQLGLVGERWLAVSANFVSTSGNHAAGAFTGPAIFDAQDSSTGFGFPAAGEVGAAAAGVEGWRLTATGFSVSKPLITASAGRLTSVISPAQLTANTDNWNPTGLSTARVIRFSTDAARNLTGIVAQPDGTVLTLRNVGGFTCTLKNLVTSTAANQFALPADIALAPQQAVTLWYDGTPAGPRWVVLDR